MSRNFLCVFVLGSPQVAADAFGGDAYSSYGKASYASSTSAYMLIYRQVRVAFQSQLHS